MLQGEYLRCLTSRCDLLSAHTGSLMDWQTGRHSRGPHTGRTYSWSQHPAVSDTSGHLGFKSECQPLNNKSFNSPLWFGKLALNVISQNQSDVYQQSVASHWLFMICCFRRVQVLQSAREHPSENHHVWRLDDCTCWLFADGRSWRCRFKLGWPCHTYLYNMW